MKNKLFLMISVIMVCSLCACGKQERYVRMMSEKLIPPENPHKITGGILQNTFLYRKCELEGVSLPVVANAMETNAEMSFYSFCSI